MNCEWSFPKRDDSDSKIVSFNARDFISQLLDENKKNRYSLE
jgi:hypothetical protein